MQKARGRRTHARNACERELRAKALNGSRHSDDITSSTWEAQERIQEARSALQVLHSSQPITHPGIGSSQPYRRVFCKYSDMCNSEPAPVSIGDSAALLALYTTDEMGTKDDASLIPRCQTCGAGKAACT